jgi:hypothetical protein
MKLDDAVVLNAKEYPQKYHWKVMIVDEAMHAHIKERADLRLANPEYRKPSPGIIIKTMAEATMMNA